ncbi:MAG: tetratricopeptide repeat protein [Promethearchaeota archaeon]
MKNIEENPEKYSGIKQFINEGKHDKAIHLIERFTEHGECSIRDNLSFRLLKCEILYQQGLLKDVITLAEEVYEESLGIGENLLSIDALLQMGEVLTWLVYPDKAEKVIKKVEDLLDLLPQDQIRVFKKREAGLYFVKGLFHGWNKNDGHKAIKYLEHSIEICKEYFLEVELVKSQIIKGWTLGLLRGQLDKALELLQESQHLSEKSKNKFLTALSIFFIALIIQSIGTDVERSLKFFEQSLTAFEELNSVFFVGDIYGQISHFFINKGEIDKALEYATHGLEISRNAKIEILIAFNLGYLGNIYLTTGEIDRSLQYHKQCFEFLEKLDLKHFMALGLNNMAGCYKMLGELDRALECMNLSIKLSNQLGILRLVATSHDELIRILIDKGDFNQAKDALKRCEQLNNQLNDPIINLLYIFDRALVLKTSSRSRDRVKAEDIFKQLIEDEKSTYEIKVTSILNICELLLTEFNISNDIGIIEEVNSFVAQLLDIAEKSHSFVLFTEIYFLKAKLAIISLDLKDARRLLTQAQRTAERFNLNVLAAKISLDHQNLVKKLNAWKNQEKAEISLTERIEISELETHMKGVLQKSRILTAQISEKTITFHKERKICLVCKGEVRGYSYICKCDAIYCENCARTLTGLENMCWACAAAIDIAKPIKPYIEDFEFIRAEEKDRKKLKKS